MEPKTKKVEREKLKIKNMIFQTWCNPDSEVGVRPIVNSKYQKMHP